MANRAYCQRPSTSDGVTMIGPIEETASPTRKISETFMDFISPLLKPTGGKPTKDELESALKVGFVAWNAVVLDAVKGGTHYTDELRRLGAVNPLSEIMIQRKQVIFPDDHRLIGRYELRKKDGCWHLWAEARKPAGT